jgi:coatomer subunit beta
VADSVVLVLLDFVAGESGYNVVVCVKSILEQYPNFRVSIVRKMIRQLEDITNADALRVALWVLSEYSDTFDAAVRTTLAALALPASAH